MIGVIADDFTGATDAAVALRRNGLRTLLGFGVPTSMAQLPPHDALVVALKSRNTPAAEAVAESTAALAWLQDHGANQIFFKYCSTFDSTPEGNIGPVLDALSDALVADTVVMTPSSPEHLRTQYLGYLFVGDLLLSESHMRNHPLTPMTDSLLPRFFQQQTDRPVSLIPLTTVRDGVESIRQAIGKAKDRGERYLLIDAIDVADLRSIGQAVVDHPLVAGAAGLAAALATAVASGDPSIGSSAVEDSDPIGDVPAVVLAGSCSARTLEQIGVLLEAGRPAYRLDALAEQDSQRMADAALTWYDTLPPGPAPVIYSSLAAEDLHAVQAVLGVRGSADILEQATGLIAAGLVDRGVRRLVVAGGETAGAIVTAIGIDGGEIGPEAALGVPWIFTTSEQPIALLLKSGNFGDRDLLADASSVGERVSA